MEGQCRRKKGTCQVRMGRSRGLKAERRLCFWSSERGRRARQGEGPAGPEQAGVLGPDEQSHRQPPGTQPGPWGALAGDAVLGGQRQRGRQKSAVPARFINRMWCRRLGPSEGPGTSAGRFAVLGQSWPTSVCCFFLGGFISFHKNMLPLL